MSTKWAKENPEKVKASKREWYARNKQHSIDNVMKRKKETQAWLRSLKLGQKCLYCPETYPACLDYHHRDENEKSFNISKAPSGGYSRERILLEISKCDLVCANCHRKLHDRADLV